MASEKKPRFLETVTEVRLSRVMVGIAEALPRLAFVENHLELSTEMLLEKMVLKLKSYVLSDKPIAKPLIVEEPATWWEHFKRDHFPAAWLRRWPVEFKETHRERPYNIYVCPHATIKWPGDNYEHVEFLMTED